MFCLGDMYIKSKEGLKKKFSRNDSTACLPNNRNSQNMQITVILVLF